MQIYRFIARLLDYPTQELVDNLPLIQSLAEEDDTIDSEERVGLNAIIELLKGGELIELQSSYVDTFDRVPEHDLHLTHHIFGDDNGRGPALIDLSEHYKALELQVDAKEIPDFLPLILEYVSLLEPVEAQVFLWDANKVLGVLAASLEKAESPYAPLIRIIENRGMLAKAA